MALTQEFYGELFTTGHWADTAQRSVVVHGSDGKKRLVDFMVHGGTATVDIVAHPSSPQGAQGVQVSAYIYTSDGALERTVSLPNTWTGLDAHGAVLLTNSQALYAVAGADFIAADSTGGYAYILYGPGVENATFGPERLFTPLFNPTVTVTRQADIVNAPSGAPAGGDPFPTIDAEIARVNPILSDMAASIDRFMTEPNYSNVIYHNDGYSTISSRLNGDDDILVTGTGYRLYRINVATGAATDVTPAFMAQQFDYTSFVLSTSLVPMVRPPVPARPDTYAYGEVSYSFSVPADFYKQFFYACTGSLLARGDRVWWGHAEPTVFPSTPAELGRFTGGTVDSPGTPERILNLTFPTSTVQFSGQPIINHQLGARHIPMEGFRYKYEEVGGGPALSISNPQHFVSQVHPSVLPSQDSSVNQWAWTVDLDPGAPVDPQAQIPDVSGVGERYTMVSGCVSVDTPFLFSNTQRGVTIIAPTEEVPNPAPSATQFVVPVRDGSGLSKDWRWYQNMVGANPFYGVPTGVVHLYLVDPVLGLWKYMGPAMEATGAVGTAFTDTGADGPFLTSQRTSRIVNLHGVLACTSLFGAMKPTMASTMRSEQAGSGSLAAYPASALTAVGFTEELWLVCSNDGTNWVKVAKLTERYHDLATGKEGDSISLKAGTTKLIGYGPRNLPIASAPCLIRKPIL